VLIKLRREEENAGQEKQWRMKESLQASYLGRNKRKRKREV
jgi:hypothetical protein